MKWIPKYQSSNKTKYASAAKDANTGESYDIYLQDGNTYDSQGNPVSVIRTPDTIITPNTYNQQLASKSYGTREKGLEIVYPEFDLTTGAGLVKDIGKGLFNYGVKQLAYNGNKWAGKKYIANSINNGIKSFVGYNPELNNKILNFTYGDLTETTYAKPWRSSWGQEFGSPKINYNRAKSFYFKNKPDQRFELVSDKEPLNYSVHFKTTLGELPKDKKMQLFQKVADVIPGGSTISTHGSISKGGIHGLERFGKDFGFIKVGERQITDKKMNPVNIPIFQKPFSKESYYKHGWEDSWNRIQQSQQRLSTEFPSSDYYEFTRYPYLVETPDYQLAYGRVNSKQATQYYNEVIKPKIALMTSEQPNVTDYAEATVLPKHTSGTYNPKSHISNIDMPISKSDVKYGYEGEPIANTLVHENYSHGTDNLIPQFIQEKYPVIPKDVEMNFNGHRYLPASHQWYESRATLNEIRFNNPDIKGDQWMNVPENELLRQLWRVNGYGNDFYHHINTLRNPWKKNFIDKLKFALSYLPASTGVPILSTSINSSSDESNKNQATK